jgi:hypothetical protein
MEYPDACILLVFEYAIQFNAISMKLCKVQWPEVFVIALIYQHTVDVEEEAIRHILGRIAVAVPVKTVYRMFRELSLPLMISIDFCRVWFITYYLTGVGGISFHDYAF